MKKFISSFLILAFINVNAALPVSNAKALSNALDNLNFSLTVDWDQQDRTFYNDRKSKFENVMKSLQEKGMTNSEMIQTLAQKMKNKKLVSEVTDLLAVVQVNRLSAAEARKYITETLTNQYPEGASWLGRSAASNFGIILLAVILISSLSSSSSSGSSSAYTSSSNCYNDYVCVDYYDYYFGYTTECYWQTSCY